MKQLSDLNTEILVRYPEDFLFQDLQFKHLKTSLLLGLTESKWVSKIGNVNIVFSILMYTSLGLNNTEAKAAVRCCAYINYTHIGFIENLAHVGEEPKVVLTNLFADLHSGKMKNKLKAVLYNLQNLDKKLDTLVDDFTIIDILQ